MKKLLNFLVIVSKTLLSQILILVIFNIDLEEYELYIAPINFIVIFFNQFNPKKISKF